MKFKDLGKNITNNIFNHKNIPVDTNRKISTIVLHCAATPLNKEYDAFDIDTWHKQRGWSGIGYHYVILLDGTIQIGRDINYSGAHVKGHNRHSIGICYIGGVYADNTPAFDKETPQQKESIIALIDTLCDLYGLNPELDLFGHNEFPDVHKSCPCLDMDQMRDDCNNQSYKY